MRYSYEFKKYCVELYRHGKWAECPEGIKDPENFHRMIRQWKRMEDSQGPEVLSHKRTNKQWTPQERYALVAEVMAGMSCKSVALKAGIHPAQLHNWLQRYKAQGYNGLILKKGRKPKNPDMKKKLNVNNPRKLNESEYEELVRLRAENAYIKAENEVIKKEIALREEKEAARLKAKKQRSLKSSEKKDTN
jgi:transposase